jgi:hypothetical protein
MTRLIPVGQPRVVAAGAQAPLLDLPGAWGGEGHLPGDGAAVPPDLQVQVAISVESWDTLRATVQRDKSSCSSFRYLTLKGLAFILPHQSEAAISSAVWVPASRPLNFYDGTTWY